uniref:Uncharacterized protein n=1 Tax=Myotis myotis TaxID=51298 RepID=A0A7J7TTM9_MYOMY|nr:hypothetical protein mMyoMyo1_008956 [Myotis myotis]
MHTHRRGHGCTPHGYMCGYTHSRGQRKPQMNTKDRKTQICLWTALYIWIHGWLVDKHMKMEIRKDTETYGHRHFQVHDNENLDRHALPPQGGPPSPGGLPTAPRTWRTWRGRAGRRGGRRVLLLPAGAPLWEQMENHKERPSKIPTELLWSVPSPKFPC